MLHAKQLIHIICPLFARQKNRSLSKAITQRVKCFSIIMNSSAPEPVQNPVKDVPRPSLIVRNQSF